MPATKTIIENACAIDGCSNRTRAKSTGGYRKYCSEHAAIGRANFKAMMAAQAAAKAATPKPAPVTKPAPKPARKAQAPRVKVTPTEVILIF